MVSYMGADATRLLTVKEYAELFRKNRHAVQARIRRGTFTPRFPLHQDGRSYLIEVPADMVLRLEKGRQVYINGHR